MSQPPNRRAMIGGALAGVALWLGVIWLRSAREPGEPPVPFTGAPCAWSGPPRNNPNRTSSGPSIPSDHPLWACMSDWGYTAETAASFGSPDDAWRNNLLSTDTCLGPSGRLGLAAEVTAPPSDQRDVDRICALRAELTPLLDGVHSGTLGSEGSSPFGFYWVAHSADFTSSRLDEAAIRGLFGTALFPGSTVRLLPLARWFSGWLQEREELGYDDQGGPWADVVDWFEAQLRAGRFTHTAWVAIGKEDGPSPGHHGGPCLPRLVLGRLPSGSVCGIAGYVTWT